MKENNKIVMIKRDHLQPHPDNPRKDLGDLTELRESIRENGIMQNLTVVPMGDGLVDSGEYQILIGHRRFAASEGVLDELPCVIVDDITPREQVGIMLAENMQRSDLTYIEQAHGFQLMLDLGDTVETISKKTGFSKTTIKHRLAINELDPDALAAAKEFFQPTINDFISLEKVKDLEARNEILNDAMCSKDIQEAVQDWLEEYKEKEDFNYYKKIFDAAGWIDETEKDQWFYYKDGFKPVEGALNKLDLRDEHPLIPEDKLKKLMEQIKGEVHFSLCYHSIMVRTYKEPKTKKSQDDQEKARKEKENRIKKNRKALREIRSQICDAYLEFVLAGDCFSMDPQEELDTIYVLLDICRDKKSSVTLYQLGEDSKWTITNKVSSKGYNIPENNPFKDFVNWTPLFQLLANMWWSFADNYTDFSDSYSGEPKMDLLKAHQTFINVLRDIGFHAKDEWNEVLDGTSVLYEKKGGK